MPVVPPQGSKAHPRRASREQPQVVPLGGHLVGGFSSFSFCLRSRVIGRVCDALVAVVEAVRQVEVLGRAVGRIAPRRRGQMRVTPPNFDVGPLDPWRFPRQGRAGVFLNGEDRLFHSLTLSPKAFCRYRLDFGLPAHSQTLQFDVFLFVPQVANADVQTTCIVNGPPHFFSACLASSVAGTPGPWRGFGADPPRRRVSPCNAGPLASLIIWPFQVALPSLPCSPPSSSPSATWATKVYFSLPKPGSAGHWTLRAGVLGELRAWGLAGFSDRPKPCLPR